MQVQSQLITDTRYTDAINQNFVTINCSGNAQILTILKPFSNTNSQKKFKNENLAIKLEDFARKLSDIKNPLSLKHIKNCIMLLPNDEFITNLKDELFDNNYDVEAIREYLGWGLRLKINKLQKGSFLLNEKVNALYNRILGGCQITLRESAGHSPSYFISDNKGVPFAILKESNLEFESSFKKHLPNMPLSASVWEHEIVGYEQDQLFGFNYVPTTLGASFINKDKKTVRGSIQEYIDSSCTGFELFNSKGADLLKNLSKAHVHGLALSGFFKGLSAAHMSNYIFQHESGISRIFEIDLEEMLLPYNTLEEIDNLEVGAALMHNKKQALKSLILCRMWILGLPQCQEPFDRASLMIISNKKLHLLLEDYQKNAKTYSLMDEESWKAQKSRVQQMQKICEEELKKNEITLTPRDLFFAIFGGKHLFEIAQDRNIPDVITFNNLVSDPYQLIVKDFSNPEAIQKSTLMEIPRSNDEKSFEMMNFFRKLAGLEPK